MEKGGRVINRKALSRIKVPIILSSFAIIMTVTVAFWLGSLNIERIEFNNVEIQTAECTYNSSEGYWKILLKINNTGPTAEVLDTAFINDVEVKNYSTNAAANSQTSTNMTQATTILDGDSTRIVSLYIDAGSGTSGTTVEVKIRSGAGIDYIKRVLLG